MKVPCKVIYVKKIESNTGIDHIDSYWDWINTKFILGKEYNLDEIKDVEDKNGTGFIKMFSLQDNPPYNCYTGFEIKYLEHFIEKKEYRRKKVKKILCTE